MSFGFYFQAAIFVFYIAPVSGSILDRYFSLFWVHLFLLVGSSLVCWLAGASSGSRPQLGLFLVWFLMHCCLDIPWCLASVSALVCLVAVLVFSQF